MNVFGRALIFSNCSPNNEQNSNTKQVVHDKSMLTQIFTDSSMISAIVSVVSEFSWRHEIKNV